MHLETPCRQLDLDDLMEVTLYIFLGMQVMTAMREATLRDDAVPALPRLRTTDRELQHLVAVRHSCQSHRKCRGLGLGLGLGSRSGAALATATAAPLRQREKLSVACFARRSSDCSDGSVGLSDYAEYVFICRPWRKARSLPAQPSSPGAVRPAAAPRHRDPISPRRPRRWRCRSQRTRGQGDAALPCGPGRMRRRIWL